MQTARKAISAFAGLKGHLRSRAVGLCAGLFLLCAIFTLDLRAQLNVYVPYDYFTVAGNTWCAGWTTQYVATLESSSSGFDGPWSVHGGTPVVAGASFQLCDSLADGQKYFRLHLDDGSLPTNQFGAYVVGYQRYFIPVNGTNTVRLTNSFISPNHTIASLIPSPPDGTTVFKPGAPANTYSTGAGWQNPNLVLEAGGVFDVLPPSSFVLTLAGEVVVVQFPQILTQPASQSVGAGANVTFSVVAYGGNLPLNHQWQFNGTDLPGQTNANLTVHNVTISQAGSYSVVVSNMSGSVTSSVAGLALETPYTWNTVAGLVTNSGFADGINEAARFNYPTAVARDSTGNLYVTDEDNAVVRKLTRAGLDWNVTTIAGLPGVRDFADGINHAARFSHPVDIAADSAGNLYVADSGTPAIRRIAPVGTNWVVTTIAGAVGNYGSADGTNGAAQFGYPALTVDNAGNVYVADSDFSTIRKITPIGTNWVVSTIAGLAGSPGSADGIGNSARFNGPVDLAADTSGNLFVADTYNHTIRKITLVGTNWVVSTIAGAVEVSGSADGVGSAARFFYPLGIATDAAGNVYVGDTPNNTVRKLTPSGTNWIVTTLGGLARVKGSADGAGSTARFDSPEGMVIDPAGNVYLADANNHIVRKGLPFPNAAPFVWIPPGTFTMGNATNEPVSGPNEDPQTQVTLSRGFWMNKYEVTQGEFQSLMGSNPSHFTGDTNRPVERVSWNQAVQYCSLLTQSERAAGRLPEGYAYRLPTEAEWEYACRAGTTNRFSFGDDPADLGNYGWHIGNSGCQYLTDPQCLTTGSTQPVGQKLPNPWGLYDMHGNVGEFVLDWSGNYSGGSVTNPVGPASGVNKLFRAPAWDFGDIYAGSATRWDYPPTGGDDSIGFRVVLAVEECLPAPSGLVAWWRGEENAHDALGRFDGTLFDRVLFATGMVGQAFSFITTNHVEIPNASELNPTAALAVEAWVYPTGGQGANRDICGKDGETFDRQYFLSAASNNRFRAHLGVPGGLKFFDGATPVQSNHWYHLVMAYDGTALKLYVNGALDGSLAVTGLVTSTTQPFRIGGGAPSGNNQLFFPGLIDEVSLYNRALSASEVSALYAVGTVGKCHNADAVPSAPAYAADFEGAVGPEWSSTNLSTTPSGARKYLGQFGNQTVRLTVTNLPAHTLARVSFDLFVLRSWDGSSTVDGPDVWRLAKSDGTQLIQTTFNNNYAALNAYIPYYYFTAGQAFPGTFVTTATSPVFAPQTSTTEINTLGYTFQNVALPSAVPMDAVYHLSEVLADNGSSLALDFSASGLEALANESWGLDNVRLELFDLPPGSLQSLAFVPVPSALYPGNPVAAETTLIASFTNGVTLEISHVAGVSFASGNSNFFTVSAVGELTALNPGATNLVASYFGLSATTTVSVLAPVTLRQTPLSTAYPGGSPVSVPLFADFSGVNNVNVTAFDGVTRSSSDPTVATISTNGLMVPLKAGIVTLTATYAGMTNLTTLTVVLAPGAAQFSDTNLVVVRVGNGTQTLASTGNSAFLDQFTVAGEFVNAVAIPDSGPTGVVMSGVNFVEGYLTRSPDHRFLSLAAYGTNYGSTANVSASTNVPRVVATFDAASAYNRTVVTTNDYRGVAWRSAATDGTNNFWGAGGAGGTIYLGNSSPRSVVQSSKANTRVVQIFNGDLYMSSASSASDGLTGIYKFNGLPKTGTGLPAALIFTNTFSTNSLQGITDFAVSPSGTIIYFADDRAPSGIEGGIQRWDFNSGSGNWANSYNLTNGIGNFGAAHLEVDWTGPNPIVFATTKETSQNRLVKVTDAGPSSTFALLATAGTNQVFRGVKFGPAVGQPAILNQPIGEVAFAGSTAIFKVAANGTEPLTYFWMKNGTNLNVPSAPSLAITNVQLADADIYSVIVSNAAGFVTSSNAVLTVTIPSGADVISDFSTSVDGWVVIDLLDTFGAGPYTNIQAGPYTPSRLPAGGNPGGCIQMNDPSGHTFFFQAPQKFLGDIRSSYGQTLSFDYREAVPVPGVWYQEADIILTGSNGLVLATEVPIVIPTAWTAFSVALSESHWHIGSLTGRTTTQAEFLGVLSGLKTLWIRGEVYYGTDVVLLDNVRLGRPGTPPLALRQSAPATLYVDSLQSVELFADFTGASNVNVTTFVGVTRTSSNPTVAAINASGVVTALKSGTVTFTAIYAGLTNQIAVEVIDVPGFNASLLAYEGFNYQDGSDLSGKAGGYGWSNAWSTPIVGDLVVSNGTGGSLTYTDVLGNTLLTSGNSFYYTSGNLVSGDSRTFRDLATARGADNTTTWISFLGQRIGPTTNVTGNPYPRGANLSLFNGASEGLAIGNASGAPSNTWAFLPTGAFANLKSSTNSFSQLSLVVVRIDHKPGNDDAYLFINPPLDREPQPAQSAAQSLAGFDYSFNRIRHFVGANDAVNGRPYAELLTDEVRIGETYATVTPFSPGGSSGATVVYNQDFEGAVGTEWSTNTVGVTPTGGRRFLGEFGNQTVRLSLTNLATHTLARVSFDLYVIRSWDGSFTPNGPDIFRVLRDGTQILRSTFNNLYPALTPYFSRSQFDAGQAFPGTYVAATTSPTFVPLNSAAEINTLGYTYQSGSVPFAVPMNSVYHLSQVTGHTSSSLALDFVASGLEVLANESWGIDNVRVEVFNQTSGSLQSLSLLAQPPPLFPGDPVVTPLTLVGAFTNGATLDLSLVGGVSRISANTNVFTVSANTEISPKNPGQALLTASYLARSVTTSVTVLNPVALRQDAPVSFDAGGVPVTVRLRADFAGTNNLDVTGFGGVTRLSSDTSVATISGGGVVTARKPGTVTLSASYAGLTNQVTVQILLPAGFLPARLANRYSFSEPPDTTNVTDTVGGAVGRVINLKPGSATNNFNGTGQLHLGGGSGGSSVAPYVNLPNGLVSSLQSVTLEGWVTWNGPAAVNWPRIFDFGRNQTFDAVGGFVEDQFNASGASYMFLSPRSSNNRARFAIKQGVGTETPVMESPAAVTVSSQVHFAVVYDPSAGVARLYLNGQRVASAAAVLPLSGVEDLNVWLGRSQYSGDPFFNGLFNEFRIYSGAMLDDEVQASFFAGPDAFTGVLAGPSNDYFTNATVLAGPVETVTGSNVGASKEPGEPVHAGNAGGSSVWWSWTAPADGTVALTAAGSSLNAGLAVYTGDTVSNLTEVISGTNSVAFSGLKGVSYKIALDGLAGVTGRIVLGLTADIPPMVTSAPQPRRAAAGADVSFTVVGRGVAPLSYNWFKNGQLIPGAILATLSLSNVQLADAGVYSVVISNPYGSATNTGGVLSIEAPYTITTYVGAAGVAGSGNGLSLEARFNQPHDVALDQSGNLYVAEHINDDIRIIAPDNIVTTTAGLAGSAGSVDGIGSAARFNNPWGLAVDASGNIFVADAFNHAIRKITPDGTVTTFAGYLGAFGSVDGQGATARFNRPRDLAFGPDGRLYVADQMNHLIRVITTNGVVSTFAGRAGVAGSSDGMGTNALFNTPGSLIVDSAGQVFVIEEINLTIRKITPAGLVTTVAGKAGYPGSRDGTGAEARFGTLSHIAVDGAGNLFVTDVDYDTIRRITPDGMVSTVAGLSGSSGMSDGTGRGARFNDPRGITADAAGNIYVADILNHTIRHGVPSAGIVIQQQPGSMTLSEEGNVDLSVQATGRGPFEYQWFFNGGTLNGATQAVIRLSHLTLSQSGQYQLRIRTLDGLEEIFSVPMNLSVRQLSWQFAGTPGLPVGVTLGDVWSRRTNEAYALGWKLRSLKADIPDTYLYRWDGTNWTQRFVFPGNYPGKVFGTGTNDLWVTLNRCSLGAAAGCGLDHGGKVYRSQNGGANWIEQALPPEVGNRELGVFSGTADNVQVVASGGLILRFNGFGWSTVFSDPVESVNAHTLLSATEGYYITCWGWGKWDGSAWSFNGRQFDFCDASATWAMRDGKGLHWYAVGNNNFANGVRVWQFDEAAQSFGGQTNFVFGDGDEAGLGSATGIWGSAADDVYVIGRLADTSGGIQTGRIYHFDGSAWSRVTEFGEIPPPTGIHGTAHDDVWIALSDGRLLHRSSRAGTNDPPVITTPPQDQFVVVNKTGVLSVAVQGTPPLRYQWYFDTSAAIAGATNPVFTLPSTQTTNAGNYLVIVTNQFGAATSAPVALHVIVPPNFDQQPVGTNIILGNMVTLSVVAAGATEYQWRKNGANIEGATNASFTIPNIQFTDGGSYTVVVANDAGAVSSDIAEVIVVPEFVPAVADYFSNRVTFAVTGGLPIIVTGFNTNATKEAGEPDHAVRAGGRSVWFTWHALESGIATFSTDGSTFDTVMAVYTGTSLSNLVELVSNDDDDSNQPALATNRFFASVVRFNATAGTDYQIAVDGFGGQSGYIVLSAQLEVTTDLLPVITQHPEDQFQLLGGDVTFTVVATGANPGYQWYQNGFPLPGSTNSQLLRTNVGPPDVGSYSVRVISNLATNRYAESHKAQLGISSDPLQGITFEDKIEQLVQRSVPQAKGSRGEVAAKTAGFMSVSAGTVGYQLGNNTLGLTDLREPNHGNLISGASLWLLVETTTAGSLVFDTKGSAINNVFAVYRYDDMFQTPNDGLIGFATNSANAQNINSVLVTNVPANQRLAMAVAGIRGQKGSLKLNWTFGRAPQPTNSSSPPPLQKLDPGGSYTFRLSDSGVTNAAPQPLYRWYRDDQFITETTAPVLILTQAALTNSGTYKVVAVNALGTTTTVLGRLLVNAPIGLAPGSGRYRNGSFELTMKGTEGDSVVLQATTNLVRWTNMSVQRLTGYEQSFADTNTRLFGQRFYRLVREGSFVQLAGTLAVNGQHVGPGGTYRFTLPPSIEVPLYLEVSTNLQTWVPLFTNALNPNAAIFTDTTATNSRARFYRLRLPQ